VTFPFRLTPTHPPWSFSAFHPEGGLQKQRVVLGVALQEILMKKTKTATSPVETKINTAIPHVTKSASIVIKILIFVMPQRHPPSSIETLTLPRRQHCIKFYCLHVPIAIAIWRIKIYIDLRYMLMLLNTQYVALNKCWCGNPAAITHLSVFR